ncbi:hypothetical protein ACKVWC_011545 [Pyricularia oryzae]
MLCFLLLLISGEGLGQGSGQTGSLAAAVAGLALGQAAGVVVVAVAAVVVVVAAVVVVVTASVVVTTASAVATAGSTASSTATGNRDLGTGDGVAGGVVVEVEQDTGVGGLVESGGLDAGGLVGAATGDLDVHALGVHLGTTLAVALVQGDDLVAEHVVAGSQVAGDGDGGLVAVLDELVGSPDAVLQTGLADLEEVERRGVDLVAAGGAAVGEVVDDGALVAVGPGVPLDGHGLSGRDGHRGRCGLGALVAGNVGVAERRDGHEPVVALQRAPADGLGGQGLGVDAVEGAEAGELLAAGGDLGDVTVGRDGGGAGEGGEDGLGGEGRHFC